MKPGYKTTEFWLTLAAMLLGAVMASGAVGAGGLAEQVIGGAVAVLANLGYSVPRASAKKAAASAPAKQPPPEGPRPDWADAA